MCEADTNRSFLQSKLREEKDAKDAEEAKKAAEKSDETENTVVAFIRDTLDRALDLPGLSALRSPLQPLLDIIDDNTYAAIGAAATILALPLFILIQLIPVEPSKTLPHAFFSV